MKIIKQGFPDFNDITFHWNLTNWCNYKCSYCYMLGKMDEEYKPYDKAYKLVLARLQRVNTPFYLELLGGEPTVHPKLLDILNGLNELNNCIQVDLITNLSRSFNFFKKINNLAISKLNIMASFHYEYNLNNDKWINKCVQIKQELPNINLFVSMNLPANKKYWKQVKEVKKLLESKEVQVEYNFLVDSEYMNVQDEELFNYSEEFFRYFKEDLDIQEAKQNRFFPIQIEGKEETTISIQDIYRYKLNKYKGYKCDVRAFGIDVNGVILNQCDNKKIGMTMPKEDLYRNIICPKEICDCDSYFYYNKEL